MKTQAKDDYKLCYVEEGFAYFTTLPLSEQWGDDWNDAPYEHNAGTPYEWRGEHDSKPEYSITKLAYEADMETPEEIAGHNSRYCVDQINSGAVAWLSSSRWTKENFVIHAGVSMDEFKKVIHESGGTVYAPIEPV